MQILLHWSQPLSYSKTILWRLQLHFISQRFITKLRSCSPTEKLGLLKKEGQAIQLQESILSLKIYTIIHLFLICPLLPHSSLLFFFPAFISEHYRLLCVLISARVLLHSQLCRVTAAVSSSPEQHHNLQAPWDALKSNRLLFTV